MLATTGQPAGRRAAMSKPSAIVNPAGRSPGFAAGAPPVRSGRTQATRAIGDGISGAIQSNA